MKQLLSIVAILATASVAQADSHGSDKLSHDAEYRVRYQFDQNISGTKDEQPGSQDGIAHRFKLGTTFKASEKLSAHLTLLHNANWGSTDINGSTSLSGHQPTGDSRAVLNGTDNGENMVLVNEAYGVWQVSDSLNVKFGRGSITLGDGNFVSSNDWQNTPFAFEGVLATYMTEAADIAVFGIRYAEWSRVNTTGLTPSVVNQHDDDPESNSYGVSINLKSLPEIFNLVNFHVQQNVSDEIYSLGGTATTGLQTAGTPAIPAFTNLRYGAAIAGETGGFDFHLNYEAEQGTARLGQAEGDLAASMYQIELGYSLPETMNSRFYLLYHSDTGDEDGITGADCAGRIAVGGDCNDDKNVARQRYDGFFYEQHRNAGLMDILAWGNLTYYSAGWTFEPVSDLMIGLHYHMFFRTVDTDTVQFQGANTGFNSAGNGAYTSSLTEAGSGDDNEDLDIGQELDIVATQKFEGGFSITARGGMFMPGEHLKNSKDDQEETYSQLFLEGRMTF
ncbi:MAG: alginate export family protein [Bdellovibrionales bacterium]|nr:alginate export family protein [Bdellovibrionales bacterium]